MTITAAVTAIMAVIVTGAAYAKDFKIGVIFDETGSRGSQMRAWRHRPTPRSRASIARPTLTIAVGRGA